MWNEAYEVLGGENVYFDTAFTLKYINKDLFRKTVAKHGADRILFATDSPWGDIKEDVELLRAFELDNSTEEMILSGNGRRLLGI